MFKKIMIPLVVLVGIIGFGFGVFAQTGSPLEPFLGDTGLQTKIGRLVVASSTTLPTTDPSAFIAGTIASAVPGADLKIWNMGSSAFDTVDSVGTVNVTPPATGFPTYTSFGSSLIDTSSTATVYGDLLATDLSHLSTPGDEYVCTDNLGRAVPCPADTSTYQWTTGNWGECIGGDSQCTGFQIGDPAPTGNSGPFAHCFIADTLVTMADGTVKNIQDVELGDVLKGETTNNTVLGFHQPKLGDNLLYSFNGGEHFVTAEHPFMTTEGWKALDPETAMQEHRLNIEVTQLEVGDVLVTEGGEVTLETIDGKADDADTQLYNFILDGDHTYYADGYLVHNKSDCSINGATMGTIDCGSGRTCINSDGYAITNSTLPGTCSLTCTTPGNTDLGHCAPYHPMSGDPLIVSYCGSDYQVHCSYDDGTTSGGGGGSAVSCIEITDPTLCTNKDCNWLTYGGVREREVFCENNYGLVVNDSNCDSLSEPLHQENCGLFPIDP